MKLIKNKLQMLMLMIILAVVFSLLCYVSANALQEKDKLNNEDIKQETKQNILIKKVDLGENAPQQCWNKFLYQFDINADDSVSLDLNGVYFNVIKQDENLLTACISDKAFEVSEKYKISKKDLSFSANDNLHFELTYQNAKLWFRFWKNTEPCPVIATGAAILDFETYLPRFIDVNAPSQIWYSDKLVSKTEGRIINFKDKKQYFNTDKTILDTINYAQVKDKLPSLVTEDNEYYEKLYDRSWEILIDNNIVNPVGESPYNTYIGAGFDSKNLIWQWDSAFVLNFSKYGLGALQPLLSFDNFYNSQLGTGQIYRVFYTKNGQHHEWGNEPGDVNPPLFAFTELQYYKMTNDSSRLAAILPALQEYADWLSISKWSQNSVHKLYWNNGNGNGMDNLPTQPGQPGNGDGTGQVDMSSQMVLMYKCLAQIDDILGIEDMSIKNKSYAQTISDNIQKYCWCEEDGKYYEVNNKGEFWKVDSVAGFWPMLAGFCTQEQADTLKNRLFDPDTYWTDVPFPALSKSDKRFADKGHYWLGGVWAPTNYMIVKGLENNNFREEAKRASQKYLDCLVEAYKYSNTLWECYAPMKQDNHYIKYSNKATDKQAIAVDTKLLPEGEKSICPATGSAGDKINAHGGSDNIVRDNFVGWTGTAPLLFSVENIIGLQFDNPEKTISWLLTRTDKHGIENVTLGSDGHISLIADNIGNLDEFSRYINIDSNLSHSYKLNVNIAGKDYQINIPAGEYKDKVLLSKTDIPIERAEQVFESAQTLDESCICFWIAAFVFLFTAGYLISRRYLWISLYGC